VGQLAGTVRTSKRRERATNGQTQELCSALNARKLPVAKDCLGRKCPSPVGTEGVPTGQNATYITLQLLPHTCRSEDYIKTGS
jgi:hypothetical protein